MFGLFARKGPFTATVRGGPSFTVEAGQNLLKAALDAGITWPHNCRVGSCGECRTQLVQGKIKELNDFSYVLTREELESGMILACQTCLRSDIEIDVEINDDIVLPTAKSMPGTIETYRRLTHDITEIGIRLDQPMPAYLAGQYAQLCLPGFIDQPRSYSFASAPEADEVEHINFYIRMVPGGHLTTWLHEQDRSGSKVEVCGPHGNFWLRDAERPLMFVCGGSGMAPIKALLEQVTQKELQRDVTLIFGARTQRDLYCIDELQAIAAKAGERFRYLPVLSEEPADSDWTGARGMCTEHIVPAVDDISACDAYLCGPPGMVDAAMSELQSHGVSAERIFYDKFLDASHMPGGRVAAAG